MIDLEKFKKHEFYKVETFDKPHHAAIVRVYVADFNDEQSIVIDFNTNKRLTLNRTRLNKAIEILGNNTDTWPGEVVLIHIADYDYKGEKKQMIAIDHPIVKGSDKPPLSP